MSVCKKCGSPLADDARFCTVCGSPVNQSQSSDSIALRCKSCNGTMVSENGNEVLVCPYCGSKELIKDSDYVAVEKIKQQTEYKRWEKEEEKERRLKEEQKERSYKFGAFGTLSIVFAAICGVFSLTAFMGAKGFLGIFSGIIALIQMLLFVASVITRRGIIKTKQPYIPTLLMIAGFVLFIPYFVVSFNSCASSQSSESKVEYEYNRLNWPDSELASKLPKPESEYGKIIWDRATSLNVEVAKISDDQFENYVSQCKSNGFTRDYSKTEKDFSAYDSELYYLSLSYNDNKKVMSIVLNAPEEESTEATTAAITEKPAETTAKVTEKPVETTAEVLTEAATQAEIKAESSESIVMPSGAKPGETVTGDLLKFTFEKAKIYDEYKANGLITNTPEPGKEYLVLFFNVENISKKKRIVSRVSFSASVDGYDCDQTILFGDPDGYDDLNGTLDAGESMKGCLAFEVKPDWKTFSLKYEKLWGDSKVYEFALTHDDLS